MDDLPTEFDVIIVGTGLSESILSAAVSRNGHTVLHLDPSEYYGGKWATLNWEQLDSDLLLKGSGFTQGFGPGSGLASPSTTEKSASENENDQNKNTERLTEDFQRTNCIRDVDRQWYTCDSSEKTNISKLSRKFNIDIYPKVILAREEIIQLLIDSNVSRYLEFKCISKLFVGLPSPSDIALVIEPIPLSRSDIFTSKSLGLVEKRKLTKFIDLVLKSNSNPNETPSESSEKISFNLQTIIQTSGINEKIQHLIKTAVQTVEDSYDNDPNAPKSFDPNFVAKFRLFLQSIGRYGNQTPYLWTLYGIGEICQAFCRLSAIYGGIFILKRSVQFVEKDPSEENEKHGLVVTTDDIKIKTKYLILGPDVKFTRNNSEEGPAAIKLEEGKNKRTVLRGILLTQGGKLKQDLNSNLNESSSENHMSVYKIGNMEIIEIDSTSLAVPEPFRLIHVTCPSSSTDQQNQSPRTIIENMLKPLLDFSKSGSGPDQEIQKEEASFNENDSGSGFKPRVIFGSYFNIDFVERQCNLEEMKVVLHEPDAPSHHRILYCTSKSTGITGEIEKAKELFNQMFPGEEFLPKAPDAAETEPDAELELELEPEPESEPEPKEVEPKEAENLE